MPAQAKVMARAGTLAWLDHDLEAARLFLDEALTAALEARDPLTEAWTLDFLGLVAWDKGDIPAARRLIEESAALCSKTGESWMVAEISHHLGSIALSEGDIGAAEAHFEQAQKRFMALGDGWRSAMMLRHLGRAALERGVPQRSRELLVAALAGLRPTGSRLELARTLITLAECSARMDDDPAVVRLAAAADSLYQAIGQAPGSGDRAWVDELLAGPRARLDPAAFAAAWSAGHPADRLLDELASSPIPS